MRENIAIIELALAHMTLIIDRFLDIKRLLSYSETKNFFSAFGWVKNDAFDHDLNVRLDVK